MIMITIIMTIIIIIIIIIIIVLIMKYSTEQLAISVHNFPSIIGTY